MRSFYCREKRNRLTQVYGNYPLSIVILTLSGEVSSIQHYTAKKHDRCQQGYMFMTQLFMIPQELYANSLSSSSPRTTSACHPPCSPPSSSLLSLLFFSSSSLRPIRPISVAWGFLLVSEWLVSSQTETETRQAIKFLAQKVAIFRS